MSGKVKQLLESIEYTGELYGNIKILGIDKRSKKETLLEVQVTDEKIMDEFGEKNEIYGVNVRRKEDDTIMEFVYDKRGWEPFQITEGEQKYFCKRAEVWLSRIKKKKSIKLQQIEEQPKIEYMSEINLKEITNKHGILLHQVREYLEDLINEDAIAPDGEFRLIPSVDGFAAKLYRSGLVERKKLGINIYRVRDLRFVNELLAKST
jgi:hypothetical protein